MGKGADVFVFCLMAFVAGLVINIMRFIFDDVIGYSLAIGFIAGMIFMALIKD